MFKPVDPALFLSRRGSTLDGIDLVPACPSSPPQGTFLSDCSPSGSKTMRSTPQRNISHFMQVPICTSVKLLHHEHFGPFCVPEPPQNPGRQTLPPRPNRLGRVINSGALLGATGGTQTHSRRTGRKLGRLRYARQGLVRVPESNTKYGGQGGITGGSRDPVMGPSISESSGNPNRKN